MVARMESTARRINRHGDRNIAEVKLRSANAFAARLDALISKIRRIQGANMHGEKASDVVLISHGHLLRGFVKRWVQLPLDVPLSLMLDPGGVGIVRYMYMTTNTIMSMSPR
ncbi:MAG: hypothetical protein Q9200_000324 [Gallowayella weberi]